jgi:predicted nucleic acid-binding protein
MKKIFLDSDVILDLLLERTPHHISMAIVMEKAKDSNAILYTSSVCAVNVHYILRKSHTSEQVNNMLNKFFIYVKIIPVDSDTILLSLNSIFKDFEDAVQYYAALKNNLEVILTRNVKDYVEEQIPVMTPAEYIKTI